MEIDSFIKAEIDRFIIKMKDIYSVLINFIDESYNSEEKFEALINTFEKQEVLKNKGVVILLFACFHQSAKDSSFFVTVE